MKIFSREIDGWTFTTEIADDVYSKMSNSDDHLLDNDDLETICVGSYARTLSQWLLEDTLWRQFLTTWAEKTGLPHTVAVLDAHGSYDGRGDWAYYENGKVAGQLKHWVEKRDGQFLLLFLACCNSDAHLIVTNRSLLLMGNRTVYGNAEWEGMGSYDLVTPRGIQNPMTLEYDLKELTSS